MRRSSAPFLRPLNPASSTVWTWCPAKSNRSRFGVHSSSSSFIFGEEPFAHEFNYS